ncbi:MAG: hypothetical protein IPH94_21750 [Saprospiraceae bacterium]|nr:hypothetical protein [Saprospiraceae bacterium]
MWRCCCSVTVQMVVFDVYGNNDTCYTVVTVLDTIAPVAVCTTTTLYLDATGNATVDAKTLMVVQQMLAEV